MHLGGSTTINSDYCVNIQFQSQPTSHNIIFSSKYTLACSFPFFQLFSKKMQKAVQNWGPMMLVSMANVVLGGIFFGSQKIKCQTTGRPRTCPPYHFLSTKSDYFPERRNGHVSFARSKVKSATRKNTKKTNYNMNTNFNTIILFVSW